MKQLLQQLLQQSLEQLVAAGVLENVAENVIDNIRIDHAKDKSQGDFASNIAMVLSGQSALNPRALAEKIRANLPQSDEVEKVEIAGAGFINFFMSQGSNTQIIEQIITQAKAYGRSDFGSGKRVLLEFVSANPTGPLHVGHGRGAAYGATVANLLAATGFAVDCEYYVNDAGRQMDILATSVYLRYIETDKFPDNGYKGDYIFAISKQISGIKKVDIFQNICADERDGGDKEKHIDGLIANCKTALGKGYKTIFALAISNILDDIKTDLAEFGVDFDKWFSEQSLADSGLLKSSVEKLQAANYIYEKSGALWFKTTDFGDDLDRVVVRENGAHTYFAADIAYHLEKFERVLTVNPIFVASFDINLIPSIEVGATHALTVRNIAPDNADNKAIVWAINTNPSIASIDTSVTPNVLHGIAVGQGGLNARPTDGSNFVRYHGLIIIAQTFPVTAVSIDSAATVVLGTDLTLTATVAPVNATNPALTWAISDDGSTGASLSNGNILSAVSTGTVVVTATADGITSEQTITIDPVPVTSINTDGFLTVTVGESITLAHTVSPADATDTRVEYRYSPVSGSGNLVGNVFTATGVGGVSITISSVQSGVSNVISITIVAADVPVTAVSITSANTAVAGDDLTLIADVEPSDATSRTVSWVITDAGTTGATLAGNVLSTTAAGTVEITATAGGITTPQTITITPAPVPVASVTINSTNTVVAGATLQLNAEVLPSDATTPTVSWAITEAGTTGATLAGNVLSTANAGTVIVTATADGVTSDTQSITVTARPPTTIDVTGISITSAATVADSATLELAADVLPTNATNSDINWTIDGDGSVATLSGITISGVAAGTVIVTATAADGSGITATQTLTVTATPITSITISSQNFVAHRSSLQLTVDVLPSTATDPTVSWAIISGSSNVATVNAGGILQGIAPGSVTIQARANDGSGVTGTQSFTVNGIAITAINITSAAEVPVGGTVNLAASVVPNTASTPSFTWSVPNNAVASILGSTLTAIAPGTVIVTATADDGSGTTSTQTFTVNRIPVTAITITNTETTLEIGSTLALTATVTPADATDSGITWSVTQLNADANISNGNILTVTGGSEGFETITARSNSDNSVIATKQISIRPAPVVAVTGIEFTSTVRTVANGGTITLTARVLPVNAANQNIKWRISVADDGEGFLDGELVVASDPDGSVIFEGAGGAIGGLVTVEISAVADPSIKADLIITVN
ncbi:MAG: arginine--tRNA ligase [Candidatus Thioglobus sp.]|nr:arginine--tRNA ligase [Candidatus Thioglobus sp.]